jgi:hypothetical protein
MIQSYASHNIDQYKVNVLMLVKKYLQNIHIMKKDYVKVRLLHIRDVM